MNDSHRWRRAAVDLACTHLTSRWTLLPMLVLLASIGVHCTTNLLHKLVDTPTLTILVGGVNLSSEHLGGLLLFWLLSYILLPVQVLKLHKPATRGGLDEGASPLAAMLPHARPWTTRLLAIGLALAGIVAIGEILRGGIGRAMPVLTVGDLVRFLSVNWLLLHLLMVGVALLVACVAADLGAARRGDSGSAGTSAPQG